MIWLRPVNYGVNVDGVNIVMGPEYNLMEFLASHLNEFQHRFESYPVKRSWLLIKEHSNTQQVYCFYGASRTKEREQWGYFSDPTTILLPYPIVANQGALDHMVKDGYVALDELFSNGYSTVLFEGVVNMWTQAVNNAKYRDNDVIRLTLGQRNAPELSAGLIQKGRIDFAYVGSGFKEITHFEQSLGVKFDIYQLRELADKVVGGNRVFCSKTELGHKATQALNQALRNILEDEEKSLEFRDLNFNVIGYHPSTKPNFDLHWKSKDNVLAP